MYTSRASLVESSDHWLELLHERGKVEEQDFMVMKSIKDPLALKLNNFINAIYKHAVSKKSL